MKCNRSLKNILVTPKDRDSIQQKVIYYAGTDVAGCSAIKNTLDSLPEPSGKGSKNTQKHFQPYMSTSPKQATAHQWKTSTQWAGRETTLPDPSESIHVKKINNHSLNRNMEKYNVPHVWDRVLFNTQNSRSRTNKNIKCTTYQCHLQQEVLQITTFSINLMKPFWLHGENLSYK